MSDGGRGNGMELSKKDWKCATHAGNQQGTLVQVLEGQCAMTQDNNLLGNFRLNGIPHGMFQIDVTFAIDANGILNGSAQGKCGGVSNQITISMRRDVCLKTQCERVRRTLSSFSRAAIEIDSLSMALISLVVESTICGTEHGIFLKFHGSRGGVSQ